MQKLQNPKCNRWNWNCTAHQKQLDKLRLVSRHEGDRHDYNFLSRYDDSKKLPTFRLSGVTRFTRRVVKVIFEFSEIYKIKNKNNLKFKLWFEQPYPNQQRPSELFA